MIRTNIRTYELFESAKQKFKEKDYELSLKYFNLCKKDKNFYDSALFEIIKIYFELKQYKKVLSCSKICLKKSKDKNIKDNIKIFLAKTYKFLNKINCAIKVLDSIETSNIKKTNEFYNERLDCSYSKFNDFFKVSEFSGNIKVLKKEFIKIKNLVPQNKSQLFFISRISNYFNNYNFTKKLIEKYQQNFNNTDKFYDNAILNEYEIAGKKSMLNSKPRSIWVAASSKCNISCQMCKANETNWSLTEKDVKDIYSYMPYLEHITWWGGEPTISNLFYEMLEYSLQYKNIQHTVITNGQYFPKKFLDIVSKNNIEVIVSIDSADKVMYETIRQGASFDKLRENLSALSNVLNTDLIKINIVVMKQNLKDINNIINFAKEFNITKFTFIPMGSKDLVDDMIKNYDRIMLNGSINKSSGLKIFDSTGIINKKSNGKKNCKGFCHIPWTDITFSYSGSLICDNLCFHFGNEYYLLNGQNMNKYWNSEILKNLRIKILKNKSCSLTCPKAGNIKLK
ncbi:MAG: radical SAM protein [Elusimicrobia bacterium]|nr:radical SAM protein [Elusimicrobiota bacterium]